MKNKLIVISGPSGVGKGTIVNKLMERGNFALSVSCTTRAPRKGEADGKSYFFITREEFEKNIAEGGFLEYSSHFENYYGTPRAFVEKELLSRDVILEIEVDGAAKVKKAMPSAILIMILPPDENALRARLKGRGSESEEKIEERIRRMDYELSKRGEYDACIVNDVLDKAVEEVLKVIENYKNI